MDYQEVLAALHTRPKYQADELRRLLKASSDDAEKRWYALRIAPQREFAVAQILDKKGIEVFLPTETKWLRTNRRAKKKSVERTYPMFVRYLFVRKPFSWLHLMAERHISGVVGFDGAPAAISEAEIDRLRRMSGAAVPHRHSVNPHRSLRMGELAEISDGPFAGQVVKIEGLHGRKAKIFLNLFGGRKLVEVDVANLEAA